MELTDEEKEERIRTRPPGGRSFLSVSSRSFSSDETSLSRFALVKMERAERGERERMERERGAGGAGEAENEMMIYYAANGALQSAIASVDTVRGRSDRFFSLSFACMAVCDRECLCVMKVSVCDRECMCVIESVCASAF